VATDDRATPPGPLIESIHPDPVTATKLLTAVGLSDPFTWCRTPGELSCGQQARYRLALALETGRPYVIVDEFLHALDRPTAAAVAWAAQRAARSTRRTLIVATTDPRIAEDLKPDVLITCNWTPDPVVTHPGSDRPQCSLLDDVTIEKGDHSDWAKLAHLHYAAGDPATVASYWRALIPGMNGPAAVAVFSYPDLHSAARNLATEDSYKIAGSREAAMKLNREVRKLSRIVVAPEVRGIGLSRRLLHESIRHLNCRYVETVAAMATHHRFLITCGFVEVPQTPAKIEAAVYAAASIDQTPPHVLLDPVELEKWADSLSVRRRRLWRRLCWHHWHHFSIHRRTRAALPDVIPAPGDPRWPDAWNMLAARVGGRPAYWILGPIEN
jgi:GNAT superfamily N-acetyltransferase